MSDYKMSECFSLPLKYELESTWAEDTFNATIYDAFGDALLEDLLEDVDGEALVHAVNSHDKLVSDLVEAKVEIEKLRKSLSDMTDFAHSQLYGDILDPCYFEKEDYENLRVAEGLLGEGVL